MKSKRGIYYNLNDSDYKLYLKENDLTFYFSSEFYKNKFLEIYKDYLITENLKLCVKYECKIEASNMLLLKLYQKIETRGFRVVYKNKEIDEIKFKINFME